MHVFFTAWAAEDTAVYEIASYNIYITLTGLRHKFMEMEKAVTS